MGSVAEAPTSPRSPETSHKAWHSRVGVGLAVLGLVVSIMSALIAWRSVGIAQQALDDQRAQQDAVARLQDTQKMRAQVDQVQLTGECCYFYPVGSNFPSSLRNFSRLPVKLDLAVKVEREGVAKPAVGVLVGELGPCRELDLVPYLAWVFRWSFTAAERKAAMKAGNDLLVRPEVLLTDASGNLWHVLPERAAIADPWEEPSDDGFHYWDDLPVDGFIGPAATHIDPEVRRIPGCVPG